MQLPRPPPTEALAELKAQHAKLREMMDRCEELVDERIEGRCDAAVLMREVRHLRLAFDAHHQYEEEILRPLVARTASGGIRIAGLFDDHAGEHHEMRGRLASDETTALRDVLASLRVHLDAEERYLESARL